MTLYAVSTLGYDRDFSDLIPIDPQPRSKGIQHIKRTYGASGAVKEQGKYIELEWSTVGLETNYQDLLAQFLLDIQLSTPVTIILPNELFEDTLYNGIAVRPDIGKDGSRDKYFMRNIAIVIKHLEVSV